MNYHYQPETNPNELQQFYNLDTFNRQQPYGQPFGEQPFGQQPFGQQPFGQQPYYPPRPPRCRWVRECRWVRRCRPRDDFYPYDYGNDY
ncbi:MAG: hypothetical protein ACQEWV_00285 [Bacillota bacterium]